MWCLAFDDLKTLICCISGRFPKLINSKVAGFSQTSIIDTLIFCSGHVWYQVL